MDIKSTNDNQDVWLTSIYQKKKKGCLTNFFLSMSGMSLLSAFSTITYMAPEK